MKHDLHCHPNKMNGNSTGKRNKGYMIFLGFCPKIKKIKPRSIERKTEL